ncbi:BatD family protein [Allopseudospirillum japonicum]|uniref:BatD family protein n=1 Tax=Allopseudospirillum japonicum TaxID=64971 RepID=UPI0015A6E24E|nr:BatD family protein [Allopseudospirillum japonicum]
MGFRCQLIWAADRVYGPQDQIPVLMLETDINQQDIYPLQPAYYHFRVLYSVRISEPKLDRLQVLHADVLSLGEGQEFFLERQGQRYRVAQWAFAVVPQIDAPDNTAIPERMFSGRYFLNQGFSGDEFVLVSSAYPLKLKAIPESFPKGYPWLPATSLTIRGFWPQSLQEWRVGEPRQWEISLDATGQLAENLPFINGDLEGFRVYRQPSRFENYPLAQSMQSIRKELLTLVPEHSGVFWLPQIRIPWWDLQTHTLRWSELAAQQVKILPALDQETGSSTTEAVNNPLPSLATEQASQVWVQQTRKTYLLYLFWYMIAPLPSVLLWWYRGKIFTKRPWHPLYPRLDQQKNH